MFFEARNFDDRMEGFGNTMQAERKHKIWEQSVFTADLCESLVRSHETAYGEYSTFLRVILEDMLSRELSDEQRTGTIQMIHALTRAELVYRRRQQHLNWHIPFHLARIVDEIVKQLLASNVGDVHVFPIEASSDTLIVIHHISAQSFNAGVININPMSTKYLPHNAERPPKVLMQSVLELKNVPKARITSEAFWAVAFLSEGSSDMTVFTHILPFLNQKTHEEIVRDSKPSFATGTKCPNGNLWKNFIHAYKYVLRKAKVPDAEVKMMRVLLKQKLLSHVMTDLEQVEEVTHSTRLIIKAALHNASLCLTRNVRCLPPAEFEATKDMIDEIDQRIESLPCPDVAQTAPPPELNIVDGWDKVQRPDLIPGADSLRRIDDVEHFIGTAVEQPRYVPVNFMKIPEKVTTLDEALHALDETLTLCTRIVNQLNVVKNGGFLIVSLLSQLFVEVLPTPLGPKSRAAGKPCIWNAEIKYGQQLHIMKRLWNCVEFFMWASFSCKTGKEFDAQRIITIGSIAAISDAVIRLAAVDFPSVISQHLRGYRRKPPFVITPGKMASQTETSIIIYPQVVERRAAVLDYHNELCEDVPQTNVMWPWEDKMDFCKATQLFLRQLCLVEGLPTNTIMAYFGNETEGVKSTLKRYWPEYHYHRDIYMVFKWMMAPKPRLPNCQSCMECMVDAPEVGMDFSSHRIIVRYLHRELLCKATALRFTSFAIPSKFTTPFDAGTEDDILHIKNLPTFDEVMGQRDAELLLSYLTAPYIRVPLVLSFFATEDRVSCLGHNTLRQLLEAVLFEPGKFLPRELNDTVPAQVPAEDPALLATALGTLVNELVFTPEGVIEPLMRLVKLAREMDAGTVHNTSVVEIILYLVRVVARIESYVAYTLQLYDSGRQVRGFTMQPEALERLRHAHDELRETVYRGFLPMIEAWNNEMMQGMQKWAESAHDIDKATRTSANLHAHILLLLRNLPAKEMTADKASMLLAGIMFLTARHTFNEDALGIPETEIFDVMQRHRRSLMRWLYQQNPSDLAYVMDSAVRIATTTGTRTDGTSFDWGFVAGDDCIGRFTRVDAETMKRPNYNSRLGDLQNSLYAAFNGEVSVREGIECINEGIQDVEINLHILSLTFKASHLVALPSEIAGQRDVHEIFASTVGGNDAMLRSMQCAIVQDAENRQWVRLVGQEHDIQYWRSGDPRQPLPDDAMRFFPDDLSPSEEWIYALVEPLRRKYFLRSYWLPPIFLLLPEHKLTTNQSVVTLCAVCSKTGRKLKEIVAYRDYNTVHVYELISLGRRWYRSLVYTSNCHFSKCEIQPEINDRRHMWKQWERHAAGDFDPDESSEPADGVVILRHPTHPENVSRAVETYLPRRLLEGLLPDALLETHRFWQDPDDNIRGYPLDKNAMHILWAHWRDVEYEQFGGPQKHTCLRLIRFARSKAAPKVSEQAVLKSQKMHVIDEAEEELERIRTTSTQMSEEEEQELGEGMYRQSSTQYVPKAESATLEDYNLMLVELMHARKGTPLHSLAQVFARIELLSHVLCWTTKVDYEGTGALTLDLVQLPRLKLTFSARVDADGTLQLYSLDHAHLFISNLRPKMALSLLQGIPHSLLLADINQSISILVPALDVARPGITMAPFSTELVITRANKPWYEKLDTRYYLYPVHVSMSFVFTPTLASSLYLLSLRFFHCEYEEVFKIASTIGTDVEFTDEERQNFNMLDSVHDWRPEAHACRAKIGLLVADSPVNMCWDLPRETAAMIRSSASIGMACRLNESEERRLLYICQMLLKKMEIVHEATKKVKEDILDTVHSRLTDRLNVFEGSPSERKQIKNFYNTIQKAFREQLNIRANKDEIGRMVLLWCKFRRWDEFPGFYQCIIDNRCAFLEAEARAIESGKPEQAVYTVPAMGRDELWAFWKNYDVISIKVPQAQSRPKNDEGRFMDLCGQYDYFYCGTECRKGGGLCKCRDCGETCGPDGGCPCASCERWNKNHLAASRYVPTVPSYSSRMLSFYDAFNWIESILNEDNSAREQKEQHVPPELWATSARVRPATMRDDQNGFLRYYECMTGTTRCRIGSGDSAKDIVQLLFPMCYEARRPESGLGHVMHYLLNNPQVWAKLPKYNRTSKQDHETRMSAIYQGIMMQAATVCKFPPEPPVFPPRSHTFTVDVTPRPTTRRDPIVPILATRILPSLSNTDCDRRVWLPTNPKHLEVKDGEVVTIEDSVRQELRGQLLKSVVPDKFLAFYSRSELKAPLVDHKMAFDLRKHEAALTSVAQSMIVRLDQDMDDFAQSENNAKAPRIIGFTTVAEVRALLHDKKSIGEFKKRFHALGEDLTKLRQADSKFFTDAFTVVERTANAMPLSKGSKLAAALMHLRRKARQEAELGLAYLISCLTSTVAESDWQQLNPFLTPETCEALVSLIASALLRANRIGHINRAAESIKELCGLLSKAEEPPSNLDDAQLANMIEALTASTQQKADSLAGILATKRVYIDEDFSYDPRFMIFEYNWNLVLRSRQRALIKEIHGSIMSGTSIVKQMIMGAGKTTVVGPLLALMLADSKNLVIQVVPPALLDFTRSILRATFSCVIQKQIFCFICDRATEVDSEVLSKFRHARNARGIVVTTPSTIKSIFLKYVEGLDRIEDITRPPIPDLEKEVADLGKVLDLWRDAVLIMDEVDMLLHPLKSELNFPIGAKHDIDFAPARWKLPMHLIDALFYFHTKRISVGVKESNESREVLKSIAGVLREGLRTNALQAMPHLTLLNLDFYDQQMKMPFARWVLLFLKMHHFSGLSDEQTLVYITTRPSKERNPALNALVESLEVDHIKTLNLAYEWINAFLPHVMQKIDRVSFGIMSPDDMRRARDEHPNMPRSRFVTSIPFIGKDLPSSSSEFAHPDVVIGLTILAYRYEGLRPSDYTEIMRQVHAAVEKEVGRFNQRRTNIMYNRWVGAAGGRLLQSFKYDEKKKDEADEMGMQPSESIVFDEETGKRQDVLPLKLMKQANKEESDKLYKLFKRTPEVLHWYLCETIFPEYMRHQLSKLSASGQELGGNIMFQRRIGFSGTPSDLLPRELGTCEYEPGTDGKLIYTLTNPNVMSTTVIEPGWTVRTLLDFMATAYPPFHALIDTGALITGMSNLQVAQYLLKHGLPQMEGVVFLDEYDRKMILVRATGRVLKLAECGIPKVKRFAFYDQVHTTGMDIEHTPNAMAIQTLGKDMTFRDFAQGAYRMRGIAAGQRVNLLVIPEVHDLINRTLQNMRTVPNLIVDVTAWLLVNSIRSEHTQHNQLCLQTIANVWRKEAYEKLVKAAKAGEFAKDAKVQPPTVQALNVFREDVDYEVPRIVPQPRMFSETIATIVGAHQDFINTETGKLVVEEITAQKKREDEVDNPVIDVQMVQEQEEEREQETEKEKEQEIEMEKFVDLAYSRDDELAVPWAVASLRDYARAAQFYKLCDFHLYKRRPLQYPESIMLSRNYFNPKWAGHRRIKNVIVSMEWLPSVKARAIADQPQCDYGAVVGERAIQALQHTLNVLAKHQNGLSSDLLKEFVKMALGNPANIKDAEWADVMKHLQNGTPEAMKDLLDSNKLRREESGRYTVALALGEAETLRRIIHSRQVTRTKLVENGDVEISLRIVPSNNCVLDQTRGFVEAETQFMQTRNYQCLRFFDSDLHYTDQDLNYVLRSLHPSPEKVRQAYFLQVIACRRRARQRWERCPIALVFDLKDPYTLLHQKTLGLCMRRDLEKRELHLADAFIAMNASHSGQLSADEVWGALRFCGMPDVTAEEVLDFIQVADTHHEGTIQYPDFLALLTGSNEIEDDEDDAPGKGGQDAAKKRHLPTVVPHGGDELRQLRAAREKQRRREEEEASKAMATEDKRIREEIEAEQMKEELAMIQTSTNPTLGDQHLFFSLQTAEVPKLSQFFGSVKHKEIEEENGPTHFAVNGDASMRMITRAIKLLTNNPVLKQYSLTCEFKLPKPTTASGKVAKKGALTMLNEEGIGALPLFQWQTNTYTYNPTGTMDEEEEESEDTDYDDYDQDDDEDNESDTGNTTYLYKKPEMDKKLRLFRIHAGDEVEEQVGERLSTTTGKVNVEWMKVARPKIGWVPFELGGVKQWDRKWISVSLNPNGSLLIDDTGHVKDDELAPAVFEEQKKVEDDDDGWWSTGWNFYMDDNEGEADDEDAEEGNANIDMGDLTDLVHALKKAKELKPGDKVTRNPECWDKGDEDGGQGTVGKIVKVEENKVTAQWPNGHKGQYSWGEAGKFELIKVGSADENEEDLGRDVVNDDRWSGMLRSKAKIKCRSCSAAIQLEQGWFKCNQCPQVSICKKCFKAMEHDEHEFTDMEALSEMLKTSTIVIGSMVRINPDLKEPRGGWGDAPRDGTPGIVVEMDEEQASVQVQFVDIMWDGLLTDVVVVDPKFEMYQTTWLGAMLNVLVVEKGRFPATCTVVDQSLIPVKVEGKYKIGEKVKAKWKRGRVYAGEIRAVLPNEKYAVAFDDGDFEPQQAESDIWPNPFQPGLRIRMKRSIPIENFIFTVPEGVTHTVTGEIKNVSCHDDTQLKFRVQFRNGTRVVYGNFTDMEIELVGKGRWLALKGEPAATSEAEVEPSAVATEKSITEPSSPTLPEVPSDAVPLPPSANIIIERGFNDGVTEVELFIRDGTYKANFEHMTLSNAKTGEHFGRLYRDPPEQWIKQKAAIKLDDEKWHVVTLLVDKEDITALCDGVEMPLELALTHYTLDDIKAEESDTDEEEDTGVAPPGETEVAYVERKKIDVIFDQLAKVLIDEKPDEPLDVVIAKLEELARDGVQEIEYASDEEWEDISTPDEEAAEDEPSEEQEGEAEEDHDANEEADDGTAGNAGSEEQEEGEADDHSRESEVVESKKRTAKKQDSDDSSEDSDNDDEEDSDSEGEHHQLQNLKTLKRTAVDCMALDVRNPITTLPFKNDEATRLRSKYGAHFPVRRLAKCEIAWDKEATPERAKRTFEEIDKATVWRCVHCATDNSRLADACSSCRRERFETAKEDDKKTKVRSVLPRSKEANELRRKLHAKLRSQYQKQLEQYDDLQTLL
jgi:hypothetical protein